MVSKSGAASSTLSRKILTRPRRGLFALLLVLLGLAGSHAQTRFNRQQVADTNVVLPPAWAFGILYGGYTDQQGTINRVKEIKAHQYPIDAYWIDSWFWSFADKGRGPKKYIDFVGDTVHFPDRKQMWSYLQQNGIKGGFWIWDCIQETGNEEVFRTFKDKGYFSRIFFNTDTWHNGSSSTAMFEGGKEKKGTLCGNIDFDNPEAVAFFKEKMRPFFEEGADFIKLDRTSKISVCRTMFQMSQEFGKETAGRGFLLSHTGGMESEAYKGYPGKWTDDTRADWTIDSPRVAFNDWVPRVAFKENIARYTDPRQPSSQIPFLTNDMGGFDMGKTDAPNEELFIRWMQFSMFCPITEVFSQPENPSSNLAWNYSRRADSLFRFYAHWRMELFPYIYSYAQLTRLAGLPMIRKIPGHLYQFMLGNEMLLAPVYEKGAQQRTLYLPTGKWVNVWTGEVLQGGANHTIAAALQQIPCFIKQGSVIPRRRYAANIESGHNDTLMLDVYPGANGQFNLVEDDGSSNEYLKGALATTAISLNMRKKGWVLKIAPAQGRYQGMRQQRNWILQIPYSERPDRVEVNGRPHPFEYDSQTRTLRFEVLKQPVREALVCRVQMKE